MENNDWGKATGRKSGSKNLLARVPTGGLRKVALGPKRLI